MKKNIWTKLLQRLSAWASSSTSSSDTTLEGNGEEDFPEFIEVTDVLDLHGTPAAVIPEMINDFIENALDLNLDRVQIIHGKGKSKLKHLTYQLLKNDARVQQFYDAPPELGGWGRTVVELRNPPGN